MCTHTHTVVKDISVCLIQGNRVSIVDHELFIQLLSAVITDQTKYEATQGIHSAMSFAPHDDIDNERLWVLTEPCFLSNRHGTSNIIGWI